MALSDADYGQPENDARAMKILEFATPDAALSALIAEIFYVGVPCTASANTSQASGFTCSSASGRGCGSGPFLRRSIFRLIGNRAGSPA